MKIAKLENIQFEYSNATNPLFENFSIDFNEGEFTFILGENGCGKSTLLKLLVGAVVPKKGNIFFGESKNLPSKKRAELIGYVPQGLNLDGEMSISDTIDFIGSCYSISKNNLTERKSTLLQNFGLTELKEQRIKFLSGGQKQRVTILLGLLHQPALLLLDEPFVGLDYYSVASIIAELKLLNTTIICVTHDIDIAEVHAQSIYILKDGKINSQGSPDSIIKEHSYYLQEIDFRSTLDSIPFNNPKISVTKSHNHLIVSYPNDQAIHELVEAYLRETKDSVSKITSSVNTLKSSMVGLHFMRPTKEHELNSNQSKPKGSGGGRGDGSGGGRNKQNQ